MGRASKIKGSRFELELSKYFTEKLNITVARSYFTRDPLQNQGEGASDLIGLPSLALEAKRVEKLSFPEAMKQAKKNVQDGEMPVVVNRRNRQATGESYVLMELDHFIELYRAFGQKEGFVKPDWVDDLTDVEELPI